MTRMMKLTALTMAGLATALVATTALADRGMGQQMGGERGMGPMAAFDFAAVDADKDGKITEAELTAWRTAQVQALDADADGLISAEELAAQKMKDVATRIEARVKEMVARLDSDGDGKLSASELAARPLPQRLFERLDTDDDGAVSQAEFDAAKERMADRRGEGHRGGKGKRGHGGHQGEGNN